VQVARVILQIAHGSKPGLLQNLLGDLADPIQHPHRQRAEERHLLGFGDEGEPIGLLKVAGDLGQQFVGGNPMVAVNPLSDRIRSFNCRGNGNRLAQR